MVNKRRGRPTGASDTKSRILTAARASFEEVGYARTSLRAIARAADVDHALVSYYFGSKEGLFRAVTALVLTPAQVIDAVGAEAHGVRLGRVILDAALANWDRPEYGQGMARLVSDAVASPTALRQLREYLEGEVVARLIAQLGGDRAATRQAAALGTVLSGLFFTRYVLQIEPIASMPRDEVVRIHAPAFDAVLAHRTHTATRPGDPTPR